jgi:hypothetical protein
MQSKKLVGQLFQNKKSVKQIQFTRAKMEIF